MVKEKDNITSCVSTGGSVGLKTRLDRRLHAYAKTINIPVQFQRRTERHAERGFSIEQEKTEQSRGYDFHGRKYLQIEGLTLAGDWVRGKRLIDLAPTPPGNPSGHVGPITDNVGPIKVNVLPISK